VNVINETWTYDGRWINRSATGGRWINRSATGGRIACADYSYDDLEKARGQLMAAAPDLARVVLLAEWASWVRLDYEYEVRGCATCNGVADDETPGSIKYAKQEGFTIGHEVDCQLVAALNKAGLR
jgi:hypothetical protein